MWVRPEPTLALGGDSSWKIVRWRGDCQLNDRLGALNRVDSYHAGWPRLSFL